MQISPKVIEQTVLGLLFAFYIFFVKQTPSWIVWLVNNYVGIVILVAMCLYLYKFTHPFLFLLGLITSFTILYKTMMGPDKILYNYPSQSMKDEQLNAMNTVPFTLEQEMVKVMLPNSDFYSTPTDEGSVQPSMDPTYNVSAI